MTTQDKGYQAATGTAPQFFAYRQLAVEIYVPADTQKFDPHQSKGVSPSSLAGQTIRMSGFRTEADINCFGALDGVEAQINIANVPKDIMNAVAGYYGQDSLVFQRVNGNEFVEVRLYDITQYGENPAPQKTSNGTGPDDQKGQLVYRGYLTNAVANMGGMPDPFLTIQSNNMMPVQLLMAPVLSYKGSVPAAMIVQKIAADIGFTLEDGGVQGVLVNPYLTGNYVQQLDKIAKYGGDFSYVLDGKTIAIWPRGSARKRIEKGIVKINKGNGMIGVPSFNQSGIILKTIYRADLSLGDRIQVDSESLPNATGTYAVRCVSHHLSSELPDGPWESRIEATFLSSPNTPAAIARHL